jgi:hypothetical protein
MQKEVVIAIIFGSVLGLTLAFGIWKANISLKEAKETIEIKKSEGPQKAEDIKKQTEFTILSPENNEVVEDNSVEISGLANTNSYIVVSSGTKDYILRTDASGEFSGSVDLDPGLNSFRIFIITKNEQIERNLVLTSYDQSPDEKEEASESADLNKAVEEKIKKAGRKLTAIYGTATDITENSVQIKTQEGEIKQVSLNTDSVTKFENIIKTAKSVQFKDLAIGDFIVAIGSLNSKEILHAEKIFITSQIENPSVKTYLAKAGKKSKNSLKILVDNKEEIINFGSKTQVTAISKENKIIKSSLKFIDEDDEIIVVLDTKEKTSEPRTVHITTPPS